MQMTTGIGMSRHTVTYKHYTYATHTHTCTDKQLATTQQPYIDTKSQKRYISPIRGEAPCEQILTRFCTFGDMTDVIICANFGMEKFRGLGNTGGQSLGPPIETTGHPYNSAALPHRL